MPSKPKKPCSAPMCRELTTERYCASHAHKAAEQTRYYDRYERDKAATAFYHSIEWISTREQALIRDHHLCQDCLKNKRIAPAVIVDHIEPLRLFWHLRIVLSNLRSLCRSCHNRKTAEDKKRY